MGPGAVRGPFVFFSFILLVVIPIEPRRLEGSPQHFSRALNAHQIFCDFSTLGGRNAENLELYFSIIAVLVSKVSDNLSCYLHSLSGILGSWVFELGTCSFSAFLGLGLVSLVFVGFRISCAVGLGFA